MRGTIARKKAIPEGVVLSKQIEVEQWSLDGSYIQTYSSIKKASIESGCNDISKCCRGKYKQSGGFVWKYKDDNYSKINAQSSNT